MGVGAGLYMCDVVKKFTFAISSPDEFLFIKASYRPEGLVVNKEWGLPGEGPAEKKMNVSLELACTACFDEFWAYL